MKKWLRKKNVETSDDLLKVELYDLVKSLGVDKKYSVDCLADHRVIRLPPYHCQYNPIELIQAKVKSYVAKRNTFKMADLKPLVKEAMCCVTQHNVVQHAENLQEDAKQDIVVDHFVESFVFNTTEISDDEEISD